MRILKSGDRGVALDPDEGRVPIRYEYRTSHLEETGVDVPEVLVGVGETTGEILTIPAQSSPRLREAREERKELSCQVRMPRQLMDVLWMLADSYRADGKKFWPAAIRWYLSEAIERDRLARRIARLARSQAATAGPKIRFTFRVGRAWSESLDELVAGFDDLSRSDLVRGAVLAAAEDTFETRSPVRRRHLEAIARAV